MEATVKDILHLKAFEKVTLVAGEEGLYRKVNNVYFMEVPDIYQYVDPNGLLLTTLYPIAGDKKAIEQFIPKLVDQQVSGIAIKPGRYIDEIPQMMLKQANDYHFPLIVLPNDANLSLLSNGILEMLLNKKNRFLEFRDEVHHRLMGLLLEGADLSELVQSLSHMVKAPVILINQGFDIITSSFSDKHNVFIDKPISKYQQGIYRITKQLKIVVDGKVHTGENVLINPIYVSKECLGYLIAFSKHTKSEQNIVVALEQASLLTAVLFQREQAILQKERNYLDSFIRDLLNQKFNSQQELIQKAKIFKWDLDFPVVLLNIQLVNDDEEKKKDIYTELIDLGVIEQMIAEKLDISSRKCKLIYHDGALVCFISVVFESSIDERLRNVCNHLIKYYKRDYKMGIAISNAVSHFYQFHKAHEQTKLTVEISKLLFKNQSFVKRYDEIGIYKLIHQIENQETLQEFVDEKIGAVIEDADLLETLVSLIQNNFNIQKSAKKLFVHYNTLRYRVDKLRELGINLADGFELAEIAIAYQIHLFLHSKE